MWGDTFVEEGNLTQYISHLRKALGDNSEDARLIVTIARKGYQFTADVSVAEAADTANASRGSSLDRRKFASRYATRAPGVPQMRRFQKRQGTGGKLRS